MLPLLGTAQVRLLDLPRLRTQLLLLRRHTTRTGRDEVDHPSGGADDVANVVSGACVMATGAGGNRITWSDAAGYKTLSGGVIIEDGGYAGPWPRPVGLHERPPERLWPAGDGFLR
jgi:hypothetical protein